MNDPSGAGSAPSTHGMPVDHHGWILVETLDDPDSARVLCVDGRPKDWTALSRATPSKRVADAARDLVRRVAGTGRSALQTLPSGGDTAVLRAFPVSGPGGRVHGVQLHIGTDSSTTPTSRPWASGYEWSDRVRRFTVGDRMWDAVSHSSLPNRTAVTAPEVFQAIVDPDHAMGLLTALLKARSGDRWDGPLTLASEHGPLAVRTAVRTVTPTDDSGRVSRGLSFAIAEDDLPAPMPSVESLALRSMTRSTRTAVALVDFRRIRLVRWLTDPVEGIQWKGMVDQRDTPHPGDMGRLADAVRALARGDAREQEVPAVRLRRLAGGWTVVDVRATLLPDVDGDRYLMVEFRTVGSTDDPDPVAADDPGWDG